MVWQEQGWQLLPACISCLAADLSNTRSDADYSTLESMLDKHSRERWREEMRDKYSADYFSLDGPPHADCDSVQHALGDHPSHQVLGKSVSPAGRPAKLVLMRPTLAKTMGQSSANRAII